MMLQPSEKPFGMIRQVPKAMLLVTEHVLKNNLQFRFVCQGTATIILYPFIVWYLAAFSIWLAKEPLGWFFADTDTPYIFASSLLDLARSAIHFVGWLATYVWAVIFVIWMLFVSMAGYRRRRASLRAIMQMYFEVILVFSVVYFYLALWSPDGDPIVKGLPYVGADLGGWVSHPYQYAHNALHAFYFSATTMVTFNSGDPVPSWLLAKLIVAFQLLTSVAVTTVVLGSFFSGQANTAASPQNEQSNGEVSPDHSSPKSR